MCIRDRENVIVGKKIPAGTGLRDFDNIHVITQEVYDNNRHRYELLEEEIESGAEVVE